MPKNATKKINKLNNDELDQLGKTICCWQSIKVIFFAEIAISSTQNILSNKKLLAKSNN